MLSLSINTSAPYFYAWVVSQAPEFPQHLAALRKQRGFSQQTVAEKISIQVVELRRYGSGSSHEARCLSAAETARKS